MEIWRVRTEELTREVYHMQIRHSKAFTLRNGDTREFTRWQLNKEAKNRKVEKTSQDIYFFD
jgi:hypothetical protein